MATSYSSTEMYGNHSLGWRKMGQGRIGKSEFLIKITNVVTLSTQIYQSGTSLVHCHCELIAYSFGE